MPTHSLARAATAVFPRVAVEESNILAAIATEKRPLSAYDFKDFKKTGKYGLPSYSTVHAKLFSLLKRQFIDAERQTRNNRIVIKYSLKLSGLLASLASPNLSDYEVEEITGIIANHLRLPEQYRKGTKIILQTWFLGLANRGTDLEFMGPSLSFFERSLSECLFSTFGVASPRDARKFVKFLRDMHWYQSDEVKAFKCFLLDFIQHDRVAIDNTIGYVFFSDDFGYGPALVGSFPISADGNVRIVLRVAMRNIKKALAEVIDLCAKGMANPNDIVRMLKRKVRFVFLPPTYLCLSQRWDKSCTTGEFCVAASKPSLIWRCPHLTFAQPEKERMFEKLSNVPTFDLSGLLEGHRREI